MTDRRQAYEHRQSNARNAVPSPVVPSWAQLRAYIGDTLSPSLYELFGHDDDPCDTLSLRERYVSPGGLTRFLSEGFPHSTSLKPFGPGQLRSIGIMESVIRSGGVEQLLEPRGFGKALALETLVPTPSGWTTMGQLRVGDVLFDQHGKPCNVTFVTHRFTPETTYKVVFDDGEVVHACSDHQWMVYDSDCSKGQKAANGGQRVVTTQWLVDKGLTRTARGDSRFGVPVAKPLECPEATLPIDPYVLGCWLGDGHTDSGNFTSHADDMPHFMQQFEQAGEPLSHIKSLCGNAETRTFGESRCPYASVGRFEKLQRAFDLFDSGRDDTGKIAKEVGLSPNEITNLKHKPRYFYNRPSFKQKLRANYMLGNKHIPQAYFRASIPQRLALLQGLMDTDGTITKNGHNCSYSTKLYQHALDVEMLVLTLGLKPTLARKRIGERDYFEVRFKAFSDMPVFRLPRKVARLLPKTKGQFSRTKRIKQIVPATPVEMCCIQVDSPDHVFLCGLRCTPTHNSSRTARAAIWALLGGFRRCGVVFQSSKEKSEDTIAKVKNELAGSTFLRALSPAICTAVKHAALNPGIAKRQHHDDELTNIEWLMGSIRLPDILGETGGGARLICMPFAKAAGLSLSDPLTLEDLRPDLLLPDDVQSHDDATSKRVTEKLLSIWHGSVKYLCGRGVTGATVFTQTIFAPEDMADCLSHDPSVHTVKYGFLESFPTNMSWWLGDYKRTLLDYETTEEDGQARARAAANELYKANREHADAGALVSWEYAYDPSTTVSAIQQALNNFIENEEAFWAQDQNAPRQAEPENDVRAKASDIMKKCHPEGRACVPDFADRLVAHIDVQDHLLYYAVCAGSATMQMGLIDRQTFPPQKQIYFSYRQAHTKFDDIPRYAELPTQADKIRAALTDLTDSLLGADFTKEDGTPVKLSAIAIDCSDGDHWDTVHSFVKQSKHTSLIPLRGIGVTASQQPMGDGAKKKNESRRGDHWREASDQRTKCKFLTADVNYWKTQLHKGLKAPLGTTECVSLYSSPSEKTHEMVADHLTSEVPMWATAKKENNTTNGCYVWTLKPNCDNHIFDNLTGCLVLLCYTGGKFASVAGTRKRQRVKASEAIAKRRAG